MNPQGDIETLTVPTLASSSSEKPSCAQKSLIMLWSSPRFHAPVVDPRAQNHTPFIPFREFDEIERHSTGNTGRRNVPMTNGRGQDPARSVLRSAACISSKAHALLVAAKYSARHTHRVLNLDSVYLDEESAQRLCADAAHCAFDVCAFPAQLHPETELDCERGAVKSRRILPLSTSSSVCICSLHQRHIVAILGASAWSTYLPEDLGDENQGWRAHGYQPWPENHPQKLQQHHRDFPPVIRSSQVVKSSVLLITHITLFGDNRYLTAPEKYGSPRARYRTSLFYGETFRTR
jgi:hypothetical protein